MDAYAQVLLIAIPGFIVLILIEWAFSWWKGVSSFRSLDTISSLSSGATNTIKTVLKLTLVIISYTWVVDKVAIFHIENTWLVWGLSFIAIDFASYWSHRLAHSINLFWNKHVIHHSSEEFNLACALRQTISNLVSLSFLFLLPAAILGLPAEVLATIAPIHLFMQFWYHTRLIPKLGWLEYILVTPSQHRVHHAINEVYLDKNLSAIFCVWDRMFGTFQEELDDVPCVYGVKRAVSTWNPIKINFQHIWLLAQDAWRAESWWDKCRLWFMPTGWRPADVQEKYPIEFTKYARTQVKYDTPASKALHIWSWFQYILGSALMLHMIFNLAKLDTFELFLYAGFILSLIYSYSSLMDQDPNAIWIELAKSAFGIGLIYYMGDWFLIHELIPGGLFLMLAYLILSVAIVAAFVVYEVKDKATNTLDASNIQSA